VKVPVTLHALVSGKVQGVFYRASLAKKARELNLKGYVRNLVDGRVEFLAQGDASAVDELRQWSLQGPLLARVVDVEIIPDRNNEKAKEVFTDFVVR